MLIVFSQFWVFSSYSSQGWMYPLGIISQRLIEKICWKQAFSKSVLESVLAWTLQLRKTSLQDEKAPPSSLTFFHLQSKIFNPLPTVLKKQRVKKRGPVVLSYWSNSTQHVLSFLLLHISSSHSPWLLSSSLMDTETLLSSHSFILFCLLARKNNLYLLIEDLF